MLRLLLFAGLALLIYVMFVQSRRLPSDPSHRKRRGGRNALLTLAVVVPLVLVATGRLSWFLGLLVPAAVGIARLLRLAMLLSAAQRFAQQARAAGGAAGPGTPHPGQGRREPRAARQGGFGAGTRSTASLIEEAYAVLGLPRSATRADIVAAHRRLIQQVHPDKGGTDYLAAKINAARDLLLRHVGS